MCFGHFVNSESVVNSLVVDQLIFSSLKILPEKNVHYSL